MNLSTTETEPIEKLEEILKVIDLDQLLRISQRLKVVKEHKHGEVSLVVKNGELVYIDIKVSENLRKKGNHETQ